MGNGGLRGVDRWFERFRTGGAPDGLLAQGDLLGRRVGQLHKGFGVGPPLLRRQAVPGPLAHDARAGPRPAHQPRLVHLRPEARRADRANRRAADLAEGGVWSANALRGADMQTEVAPWQPQLSLRTWCLRLGI